MKQHDWFAANLFQPELSIDDFYNAGLTPDNTGIKSRDEYKTNPTVIDAFTKDGVFDEQSYNTFYDNALLTYNQYSKKEFNKKVLEEYEYDPAEWRASGNKKDTSALFQIGKQNLRKESYGVESLGLISSPEFSMREIAQMNEVRDAEGNKLGYTPNEKGGLFKGLGRETLVLAQWEEGEIENINGREIVHKKGDLKLDENGNPYYEELGDRDIYGKDVLHYTDTLTDDGSKFNKYDFFDSDGLEKSIGGTLMKTAAKLAPYVISGTVGGPIGWIWGGINAALEISKVLPTLGKAVNGIFGGSDKNDLAQGLSKWEGYLARFESSTSDATRNQPWSVETLGDLVSDIAGQLYQQRVVSMIPSLLDKAGFTKGLMKNKKLGEELALGYMAATSARESYGSFREAGANETTAGLAAIANLVALNGLMRTDYFRSTLFKGSFFDDDILKGVAKDVAKQVRADNTIANTTAKATVGKLAKWYESSLRNKLTDYGGAMLREGLEEMMEESVSDISKGLTEGLNALGFKVTSPNKNLDFGWNGQDFLTRYGMSFIGGAIGGGIFNFANDYNLRGQSDLIKQLDNSSLAKMSYLIAEGRGQEIKDYYTKMYKKGLLGDSNLSASKFQTVTDINGNNEIVAEAGGKSQNDMIYEQLIGHIDYMETLISEEGLKVPHDVALKMAQAIDPAKLEDHRLLRAQALNLAMVNGGFLNDFNRLTAEIVKERANLDSLIKKYGGETDKEKRESGSPKENEDVKKSLEKLKVLREERDAMLSGERMWFYTERGRFVMDEGTHKNFIDLSIEKFTEAMYNKRYVDLSESEKEQVDEDYKDYLNKEGKRNIYRAYEVYNKVSEMFAEILQNQTSDLSTRVADSIHSKKRNISSYFEKLQEREKIANEGNVLEQKESLTSAEEARLAELRQSFVNIEAEIKAIESSMRPNEAMRGSVEGETPLQPLINSGFGGVLQASVLMKDLYNKYISTKTYVRSEDELDDFYRFAKMQQTTSMTDRVISLFDDLEYNPLFESEEPLSEKYRPDGNNTDELLLMNWNDTAPQQEFVRRMQELEKSLGTKAFWSKYQETMEFIKENAKVSDEQADFIISDLLSLKSDEGTFSFVQFTREMDELRSKTYTSPIWELLEQFSVEFSDGKVDIVTMLKDELGYLATRDNITDYIIRNPEVRNELERISKFLNVLKGMVNGAYSGLNESANKLRDSKLPKLAELDENSYKLLMDDIVDLQYKLQDIFTLDHVNKADKLKVHKQTELRLKPKQIQYLLSDGFVNAFESEFGINLKNLWGDFDLDSVSDNNWSDFESARIAFESAIYDAVKDLPDNEKIDSLFKLFGKNLYHMESTRINPNTTVWSGYDIALYLMDVFSMKSSDFSQRYKEVLERRKQHADQKLAPVFGQELAIRRSVCMAANINGYNLFMDKLKDQAGSDSEIYIQNKRTLHNVSAVFGGAGTGKTVAISSIIAEMLAYDDDIEFVYIAPGEAQVEKLKKSVGYDGKQYVANEFFNSFTTGVSDDKMKYDVDKEQMQINPSLKGTVFASGKSRKVIIVDESTLFNSAEWLSLSKIAEKEGAIVIALGDLKQNQAKSTVEKIKKGESPVIDTINNGIEDFFVVKSPLLTTSLRSGNEAKFQNATTLDEKLSRVLEKSHTIVDIKGYDAEFNAANAEGLRLGYYNSPDGSTFVGEMFVDNDAETIMFLRRFAKEKDATIAYITDKENFELPPDLKSLTLENGEPKIKVVPADKAQGGEFTYVIVDKKWDTSSTFNLARDLYTLTQRSTTGTIIVDNGAMSALKMGKEDNYSDKTLAIDSAPSGDAIEKFVDWKLENGLGNISVVSTHFAEYFPVLPKNTADDEAKEEQDGEPQEGVDEDYNDDDDSPEEKPQTGGQTEPSDTAEEPKQTEKTEPKKGSVPPVTEKPDSKQPTKQEYILGDPELPYEPSIIMKPVLTQELVYNKWINTDAMFKMVKDSSVVSSKHLDFELTTEQIKYLVPRISGAIKAGVPKEEFVQRIFRNLILDDAESLMDFLNDSNMELWVEPLDSKRDVMVARFIGMGEGKPEFKVPITFIEKGHIGKYVGGFHLKTGPTFERTETWKTLDQINRDFPGLYIFSTWGVLSDGKDQFEDVQQKHDSSGYSERNNGKVMTFVTDNIYLAESQDQSSVWEHGIGFAEDEDGEFYEIPWVHQNYPNTRQFGVEKPISVRDFLRFLRVRQDRMDGTLSDTVLKNMGIEKTANEYEREILATDVTFKTKPGKDEDSTAFNAQMGDRRFQVVNYQTRNAIMRFVFNSLPSLIDSRFGKDILLSLRRQLQGKDDESTQKPINRILQIKSKGEWYYLKYNFETKTYDLFKTSGDAENGMFATTNVIRSFPLEDHHFPINSVLEHFGGKIDSANFGFINDKNSVVGYKPNRGLYMLFSSILGTPKNMSDLQYMDEIETLFTDSKQFQYGIFPNIAGGGFHMDVNCTARTFIGTQSSFITDAGSWNYSVYELDVFEQGTPQEIERQSDVRVTLEEDRDMIKRLLVGKLDVSKIEPVLNSKKSTEEMLSYVNNLLYRTADSWFIPQIKQDETGEFKLVTINSPEAFINNKIAEFGFTTNNATINYKFLNGWKSAIFSVSLLGNSKTYILQYNESTRKWEHRPFESFALFATAYESAKEFENQGYDMNLVKNYLRDTVSGTNSVDVNELYRSREFKLIQDTINNYLLERLNNDEC